VKLPRRKFLHLAAGAAALPMVLRSARAQAYPSRPVTMVVPFPAGGPSDTVMRIVTERMRGMGIGKQLFERTMQHAIDQDCSGMTWQVLDWNEPAIHFYKKYYNAKMDPEWLNCSIQFK